MELTPRTTLTRRELRKLARRMNGELLQPGDLGYEEARLVWNGMIDRRPALIARCADAVDVIAAVDVARRHGLVVAVGGGRHNVAGYATCDGGLAIDLSPMNEVEPDFDARRVHVGGGCRWGEVDAVTSPHGLAVPGGVVSDTGVGGLTLGGGLGWLRGPYGLSCDNLVEAEVVTAAGELLRASEDEHPELLWGLRGGGGNFGVVTRFTFRLREAGPEVWFTFAFHDGRGEGMKRALQVFRDYAQDEPDGVSSLAACGIFPPGHPVFPAEVQGRPFVLLAGMYAGDPADGERALSPLRDFAEPAFDLSGVRPYVEAQQVFDEDYPSHAMRYYWKSRRLERLDDEVIDLLVEAARRLPTAESTLDLWATGRGVREVAEDATAFSGRDAPFYVNPEANWREPEDDGAAIGWARAIWKATEPYSRGGVYLNFPGFHEEGQDTMRATFGEKYERLVALKRRYDPTNLFRLNQNVRP